MVGRDERHPAVGAVVLLAQSFEHRQLCAAAVDEQKLRRGLPERDAELEFLILSGVRRVVKQSADLTTRHSALERGVG